MTTAAEKKTSPYVSHVFVCTNDRHGERRSCGDGGVGATVRAALKQAAKDRGWRGKVRVSSSGCLGLCEKGPNVMLYPQGSWYAAVSQDDLEPIVSELEQIVSKG